MSGNPLARWWLRTIAAIAAVGLLCVSCSHQPAPPETAAEPDAASAQETPVSESVSNDDVSASTDQDGQPAPGAALQELEQRPEPSVPPAPSSPASASNAQVESSPLGTFAVPHVDAGVATFDDPALREIPAFDEPFGEPRVLVDVDPSTGTRTRLPLVHGGLGNEPLVLRVIATTVDGRWVQVAAPVRPAGQSTWVAASDVAIHHTPTRVEVDLAAPARLRLIEGGAILNEERVAVGRSSSPTPTGLGVVASARFGHGEAGTTLPTSVDYSLSGFSGSAREQIIEAGALSTLAGAAATDGKLQITDAVSRTLARTVAPGTPVLVFDSSSPTENVDAVASRALRPAETVPFDDAELPVADVVAPPDNPLWQRCASGQQVVCVTHLFPPHIDPIPMGSVFAVASDNATDPSLHRVVPVFAEPGGDPQVLLDRNPILNLEPLAFPLVHPTVFDEPLVLRVVSGAPGDEWLQVQAPIRPHRQTVWIRADDVTLGHSLTRVEVDLANGMVTMFERSTELISSRAVYRRPQRPTTPHDTYVEQALAGDKLGPAYGTHILTIASYSQVLPSYGGGLPGQSLHGTDQPELVGQSISSGGIRVPNEIIDVLAAQPDIVGASVVIYDSSGIGRVAAMALQRNEPWTQAVTTDATQAATGDDIDVADIPVTKYS